MGAFVDCWEWFLIGIGAGVGGSVLLGLLGAFGMAFKNMLVSNQFSFMSFAPRPLGGVENKEEEENNCQPATWFQRLAPSLLLVVGIILIILMFFGKLGA